ncbi:MAG: copper chaperone PCu(A)C [Bacteroidota bacterium]
MTGCGGNQTTPETAPDTGTADPAEPTEALTVRDAWSRPAPDQGMGAAYLEIANTSSVPDTLLTATSNVALRVELHETFDAGEGMRGMREVEAGFPIPAGGTLAMEPGGFHVMLIGLREPLVQGAVWSLELNFAQAGTRRVEVTVRSLEAESAPPSAGP